MEIINYLQSNPILAVFIAVCIITFLIKLPCYLIVKEFYFSYNANTSNWLEDNYYQFHIKRIGKEYRCYIECTPPFRGRDTSNYTPHYWVEPDTDRHYICWTGKIAYPEQAKTLCRNWADATQQFIDTGKPAPGFERE